MTRKWDFDAPPNEATPAETNAGQLSRRQLMKGAAGAAGVAAGSALAATSAGAATTTPAPRSSGATNLIRSVDVAVIGAGISGLYAAYLLSKKPGTSFAVIESRGRTGGRILNVPIGVGNQVVEGGAEFIGAQDKLLRELVIRDLKLPIYDTYGDKKGQGAPLVDFGRRPEALTRFSVPLVPIDIAAEALAMMASLDDMASSVNLSNPTKTRHAGSWDVETFQSWLEENIDSPTVRRVARQAVQGLFGGVPADASLLHFLYSIHAHGGVVKTGSITGGAQQNRVVGGSQLITNALANRIGTENIILGAPVRAIDQSGAKIVITTDAGTVQAGQVILAIPPTFAGAIDYTPILSPLRAQLTERTPMGYAVKVHATYPKPFWRELRSKYPHTPDGLCGVVVSGHAPISGCFDNSPGGARATTGVLLGFTFGDDGRVWGSKPPARRRAEVLAQFVRWFGPRAAHPIHYMEQDWAREPWTRGYIGYIPTNTWLRYEGAVKSSIGRIHLAGTETAGEGYGGMEGALLAATRAVKHATG